MITISIVKGYSIHTNNCMYAENFIPHLTFDFIKVCVTPYPWFLTHQFLAPLHVVALRHFRVIVWTCWINHLWKQTHIAYEAWLCGQKRTFPSLDDYRRIDWNVNVMWHCTYISNKVTDLEHMWQMYTCEFATMEQYFVVV